MLGKTMATIADPPFRAPRLTAAPAWLLLAGLAACLGYFAVEAWLLSGDIGFPLDDSWIHLQFARNLAAGRGLSYNPGEPVTGSTAPLWTALMSLLFYLPGSVVVWAKLLGVLLYLAGADASYRLGRELGASRGLASLGAFFTLSTGWLVWAALSGMEVALFVLLSLWAMILHLRERTDPARPPLALAVFAVAVLARPEGALLLVLALADRCLTFDRQTPGGELSWRRPALRPLLLGTGLAACALAGPLLYYRLSGGSFLPTTFAAKGGEVRRFLPEVQYVYVILGIFMRAQPYTTLLCGAGVLGLVERLGTPRDRGLLPALWLIALPLAYSTISPLETSRMIAGNFGRYYFPLFPVVAILGALGLERAARALRGGLAVAGRRLPLGALLLLLLLWPGVSSLVQTSGLFAQSVANVHDSDVRVARWLAARLPREAVLAVNDIGALKYFTANRVVDLVGIATPEFRREVTRETLSGVRWQDAVFAALGRRHPDYLVIFPSWFPSITHDSRFHPVYGVKIPDNITMGGTELLVYATPWTRYPLRQLPGDAPKPGGGLAIGSAAP
ncbi:MAG: hypothetical protein M3O15_03300 [Acidobacteriota bacterium]|nr:hypothetical protein [Acidobacteriota bacterium]